MKSCINCPHPSQGHTKTGACRFGGCPCPGFNDGTSRAKPPGSRRVAIDVPDGYTVSISLIPWDTTDPVIEVPVPKDDA